jgi:hypothetical protein
MPQLQGTVASETGRLLRVLLVRFGEVPPGTGAARMLRLTALVVVMTAMAGCTWQQAYSSTQGWQQNQCYRLVEQTERERCLANASTSYDDYRRQIEGAKKD